jgi:O-antigen ligase
VQSGAFHLNGGSVPSSLASWLVALPYRVLEDRRRQDASPVQMPHHPIASGSRAAARAKARTPRSGEVVERVVFGLFVVGLAGVPYWYGSNDRIAWGVNAIVFPGLAALYELSLLARSKSHPVPIGKRLLMPVGLFLATLLWIWFQALPWRHIPFANPIWDLAGQALERPIDGSISVNRDLTNLALLRLITAGSVLWLAIQLCRGAERALALLGAIVVIVFAYAAYGLVGVGIPSVTLPGLAIPYDGGLASSTFVNRNTFATYAGLGLVAAAGLILRLYRHETVGDAGWRLQLSSLIEVTGGKAALPLASAFVILVALLLTGSRGGVIATGIGLLALGLQARRSTEAGGLPRFVVIGSLVLLAAVCLLVFGGFFISSIEQRGIADANRLAVYLLTIRSILDAPLTGHGYGTFADVFPFYRDRSLAVQGTWAEAHNTYLEVFQGLGMVFGGLLVASVVVLVLGCLGGPSRRQEHVTAPRVAVAAAVLVGVHALVDFSLQIQAVTLTFMAILGAGVGQSQGRGQSIDEPDGATVAS